MCIYFYTLIIRPTQPTTYITTYKNNIHTHITTTIAPTTRTHTHNGKCNKKENS